ncbi:TIGR03936 family radical SAM-associated protein [Pseudoramibacter sp.]|jgi:radical SAM-linked protein|uniref:TIGR03936 family radical SAM-associated protein n=1 Tax=Pseudoramibacter sp. TaxID=2034862 RepID=UPI0025F3F739|nr:TIGR03936 family radical SAM-associated protein [Pseudoramibacter sp.]MCH4072848.1 TIGR03936 family radical SAM-associated protein [Pseudoramibacter sp.]MCH4106619.1 TIGR03936 family radical SAM-associated protein [Pseudoramibacter sp.]
MNETIALTMRFQFARTEELRFLSHLDQQSTFQRAFRRADIPIAYSNGFHAHQRLSFATALSVGMTSSCEYADIRLTKEIAPETFCTCMNRVLPKGLHVIKASLIKGKTSSLSSLIISSIYQVRILDHTSDSEIEKAIQKFLCQDDIIIEKRNKKGKFHKINARPYIKYFSIVPDTDDLLFTLRIGYHNQATIKPSLILQAFEQFSGQNFGDADLWQIHRNSLLGIE